MSPRAAWRLEQLGVGDVADYAGGKMDWLAHGLPFEGCADLVGQHVVPFATCRPDEYAVEVIDRLDDAPMCAVTVADGVLVGMLDAHDLADRPGERAGDIARFGTTTVRPSEERDTLDARLRTAEMPYAVVTDAEGRLLGLYQPGP